jgi:tetratricopeptide (TPR) repeat protein
MERVLIIIMCLLLGSLAGCGDDEDMVAPDAGELVSQGWKEYVAGNYEDAIAKYEVALEVEQAASLSEGSASASAHNGIGWARARLGQIRDSIDSFKRAVAKDPGNADAHAGLAGAYLADGDYERAIASAKLVLSLRPEYISHHDNIKAADILILLAECYYNIGDYTAAEAQIDLLGGSSKALDAASPTYPADLLSLIEELAKKDS